MLSSLKGFVSRHRRKFIVAGAIIGGTALAVRYVQYKIRELQEKHAREFVERTRRMQHFKSTERTCNQAIIGLSTNLCDEILKLLSTDEILQKLRNNPGEKKVELFEELKVICFTRLTTLIYASSMLVVALRVQLNILGGYLYKDTLANGVQISDEIRQNYLSLVQYFLSDGLVDLVDLIKCKVNDVLKPCQLTQKFNLSELEQIFWSVQMAINGDSNDPNSKISNYVLPKTVNDDGILQKMYNETLDILESEDVATCCSNNASRGLSIALDCIAEYFAQTAKSNGAIENGPSTSKDQLNTSFNNFNNIQLRLAKLIPIINVLTAKTFSINEKPTNFSTSLITFFLVSEKIKMLGANVYEGFSV